MKLLRIMLLLALIGSVRVMAQNTGTGTPPFGSFTTGTPNDVVNNQNLNVRLIVPMSSQTGRGPVLFRFGHVYNAQMWIPVNNGTTTSWTPVPDAFGHPSFGWQTAVPTGNVSDTITYSGICVNSQGITFNSFTESNFVFIDPQGTRHPFPTVTANMTADGTGHCIYGGNTLGYAGDASGYFIEINLQANPPIIVHSPSGIQYQQDFSSTDFTGATFFENIAKDPNGNYITGNQDGTWSNTNGSSFRGNVNPINGNPWLTPNQLSYQGVTINLQTISIQTAFGCSGIAEYSGSATVPATIALGNGQSYAFTYELTPGSTTTYTGRLKSVTLPTGGSYQYEYTGANGGIKCADGTTMNLTRTINDGAGARVWTFARNGTTTTITAPKLSYDPAGNDTVLTFDANGREISSKVYQGSSATGTPLSTTNTTWAANGTPATVTTKLEDARTQSETDTTYNSNGILQNISFYDFGAGAHGPLLKQLSYTHLADSNSNYAAPRNLISLVSEVQVTDASGMIQSRTHINYDESGAVTSCPSTWLHDDANFGCGFVFRGNASSVLSYKEPATPANPITRSTTYDGLGNTLTVSLNGVQQKSYTFTSSTLYTNPTTIVTGPPTSPQLTNTFSYSGTPSRLASATDNNGLSTTYSLDSFGRFSGVTLSDGSKPAITYDDANRKTTFSAPVDTGQNMQIVTALDVLGRVLTTTTEDGSGSVLNIVQNQYDEVGRLSGKSNPYLAGVAPVFTTVQFDALGRPTKTILPDGQQTAQVYSLQTVTLTDPTGKQVKNKIDSMGRLLESDVPGGAATPATPGSGSATINGTERSVSGAAATPGTGSVVLGGSEQSKAGTPGITASGSITISGAEKSVTTSTRYCAAFDLHGRCVDWEFNTVTDYDSGTITLTLNGHGDQTTYGQGDDVGTIANRLAGVIRTNSPYVNYSSVIVNLSANPPTATINLVSRTAGVATNYTLSTSSTYATSIGPSFAVSPASGSLTGGTDAVPTAYDSGTCTATINGTAFSASFGQGDTTGTIASRLAGIVTAGTLASGAASGATVLLTAKTGGAATNYSLSSTCSYNSATFAGPSFTNTPSGSAFTGGQNAGSTVFDTGTVTLTANGVSVNATYNSNSTSATVATALAAALNISTAGVQATASGSTINMVASQVGSNSNYTLSTSAGTTQPANFTGSSFSASLSGGAFTGGTNAGSQSLTTPTVTLYTYNVLDKVKTVSRGQQTRTYGYNALGWMTSMVTPETAPAAVTFVYNDFGLTTQSTDPRGVITTFGYDALNRPTSISYDPGTTGVPATPGVTYTYGTDSTVFNNGKLVTMTDGIGSETYRYDVMGRKILCTRVINGVTYATKYAYNLAGEPIEIFYPSNRVVKLGYDGVGRLSGVTDIVNTTSSTYASGLLYNTAQQLTQLTYANGVVANLGYSSDGRQQLTSLQYTKGTQTLFGLNYGYAQNGGNNGQITNVTDLVEAGRSTNYLYDSLGQLQQAYATGSTTFPRWDMAFTYDVYGNRTDENIQPDTSPSASVPSNHLLFSSTANTNRIITAGYAYDANGNLTSDGVNTLVYDAASRLVSSNNGAATYMYDGYGQRLLKCGASCATSSTVYIFSGGALVAEYDNGAAASSPSREYITVGGTPVAKIEGGATQYYLLDHLSIRALADASGNKSGDRGNFPFGEQWYASGTTTKFQFTTYERDSAETGNDYAMARYFVNRLGRFNAVDPVDAGSWLNRYVYSMNDPINMTDSQGTFCSAELHIFDTCGVGDGGGGRGGIGPSMTCILDGVPTPCSTVLGDIDRGEAGQCPNNDCQNGKVQIPVGYEWGYVPARSVSYLGPNPSYDPTGDPNGIFNQPTIPIYALQTGYWGLVSMTGSLSRLPSIPSSETTIGPIPVIVRAPHLPPGLDKVTNSHSYGEFVACTFPRAMENVAESATPVTLAIVGGTLAAYRLNFKYAFGALAAVAAMTIVPAMVARSECNKIVGGVF